MIKETMKKPRILSLILIVVLIGLSLWAGRGLFKYSVYSTHDGDHHISRSFDAIQTIKEGQFPLRWAGSLNFHCGVPIYNFFYPLFYYLVIIFNLLFGNVYLSLKFVSLISLLVGTVFFYLWANNETKNNWAGFGGAVLYLFAPYRFLLIFVRESPEFLAYGILPVVLYFFSLCFENNKFSRFFLFSFLAAIFGGLLAISHNFTVMFLMPIILVYLVIKMISSSLELKRKITIALAFISSFGLGSFFIFPALLEKKYTKIGIDAFLDFRQHFPTLNQLIRSPWGYFYSSPGTINDGMSFQLGYAHWLVLAIVFFLVIYFLLKRKIKALFDLKNIWVYFYLLISVGSIFLILPWSLVVWEKIPIIQQVQFSWRLLGIAVFAISALFAFLVSRAKGRFKYVLLSLVVTLAIYGNRNHLLPQPIADQDLYRYDDYENLHPHRYSTTTLGDDVIYRTAPKSCSFDTPVVSAKNGDQLNYSVVYQKNTSGLVNFSVGKQVADGAVKLGLGFFPGAYVFNTTNGVNVEYQDCQGQVCISGDNFSQEDNYISWRVIQTPIQKLFNAVSLVFIFTWLVAFFWITIFKKPLPGKRNIVIGAAFVVVFGLFSYFRFNDLPQKTIFNWDQERDAQVIREMFDLKKPVLIGPRVLGPKGFFLPPVFYYVLAPFYLITGFSPFSIVWFIISYNLIFFVLATYLLSKMFSWRVSLIFLSFWAVVGHFVSIDIISWNPLLIPLMSLLFLYIFKLKQEKTTSAVNFLFGLVFGLGVGLHVQFLGLVPILVAGLISKKSTLKQNLLSLIGTFLPFVSLLVFDLRHQFINTKLLIGLFLGDSKGSPVAFLPVWHNVISSLLKANFGFVGPVFFLVILALIIVLLKKSIDKLFYKSILAVWIAFPLAFALYGQRPSEYYFNYLLPIALLALSAFVDYLLVNLKKLLKGLVIIVSAVWVFVSAANVFTDANPGKDSLYYKAQLVQFLSKETKDKSAFNLSYDLGSGGDAGFHYLADYYQVGYSQDEASPLIEVVLPSKRDVNFKFGASGLLFPSGWLEDNWL